MAAVLITLLFGFLAMGLGDVVVRRWTIAWDPALRLGVAGLTGLGAIGLALFGGVVANGHLAAFLWAIAAISSFIGAYGWFQLHRVLRFQLPRNLELLFPVAIGLTLLMGMIVAAGPSDSLDWDTLAYHIAVPKLWLSHGQIDHISFIHQSNFPFVIDNLYLLGLSWGGASGAKAFTVVFFAFGALAVFGLIRSWSDRISGWWSLLAYAGIPVVLWETGTGYIDAAHGLYAGMSILLLGQWAASKSPGSFAVAVLMGGLAAASKYTGLQIVLACSIALFLFQFRREGVFPSLGRAATVGLVGLALCSPWLVRNLANTGNPVFPFLYERFGGKNWNQFSADIYRDEQQTFGVGRVQNGRDWSQFGHAVVGLAYQPGRYVNPRQTEGGGFPTGALGFAGIAAGLLWCISRRAQKQEAFVLSVLAISLIFWFALSQQSRYMATAAIPLAALAGLASSRFSLGTSRAIVLTIVSQFAYTVWMVYTLAFAPRFQVVLGKISAEEFYGTNGPALALNAPKIDEAVGKGKVALFDEVFGSLLSANYFWANPGHSTEIPYAKIKDGDEFAASLANLGMTHCYVNFSLMPKEVQTKLLAEAGLAEGDGYTVQEETQMMKDPRSKWPVLLAQSIRSGHLFPELSLRGAILFRLVAQ